MGKRATAYAPRFSRGKEWRVRHDISHAIESDIAYPAAGDVAVPERVARHREYISLAVAAVVNRFGEHEDDDIIIDRVFRDTVDQTLEFHTRVKRALGGWISEEVILGPDGSVERAISQAVIGDSGSRE